MSIALPRGRKRNDEPGKSDHKKEKAEEGVQPGPFLLCAESTEEVRMAWRWKCVG
jgi:hypothetical protein